MAASLPGQVDVVSNNTSDDEDFSYFDVLVVGNTGMGKSTLANKLIGIGPETKKLIEAVPEGVSVESIIKKWDIERDPNLYFETGDGYDSVTKTCKVLSNENTMNRVLDAPGFTDVDMAHSYGAERGNWQCLRMVLQKHREHDLRFSRVVYFMPKRGPPERVEGTFQEELKIMHDYFGQKIFDIMVIAVTNHKREAYQARGFMNEDLRATMEVFMAAYEGVTDTKLPKCPPIIYLPFDEDHQNVLSRVVRAEVISDAENLAFSPEFPIHRNIDTAQKNERMENECEKCAVLVITEKPTSGEGVLVRVRYENGDEEAYDSSKCHPDFIPKHSRRTKIIGGIAHVLLLGLVLVFCYKCCWPGFTNSEKICMQCKRPPRTEGCCPINQEVEIDGKTYTVKHA